MMSPRWLVAPLVGCLAGCLGKGAIECADGVVCPADTACDDIHHGCVRPSQLTSCAGLPDGDTCPIDGPADGLCDAGVCVRIFCGDGIVNGKEECDGDNLNGATGCASLGYYNDGPIGCTARCVYDVSQCHGICGDGVVDPGHERCDRMDLGGRSVCSDLGYYDSEPLSCTPECTYDTTHCTGFCGDGVRNGPELCEGTWDSPQTCIDFGFDVGRMGCTALCGASFDDCGRLGWVPAEGGVGLARAVWGRADDDVWAVGQAGIVSHWNGSTWSVAYTTGGGQRLQAVWASGPNDVWAVGYAGTIVHYDGTTWTTTTLGATVILFGVWGFAPNDVWAVGADNGPGTIRHYDGTTWSTIALPPLTTDLRDVWGISANDVWVVGSNGTVLHYDGTSWTQTVFTYGDLRRVWGSSASDVWAVGLAGAILHYDGTTATRVDTPLASGDLVSLSGTGPKDIQVLAVSGTQRTILHYDGANWTPLASPPAVGQVQAVWSGTQGAWAVGVGSIYFDRGATWAQIGAPTVPASELLDAAWSSSATDVWAVSPSSIVHYDGTTWTTVPALTSGLAGIWGSGPSDIWALGASVAQHYDGTTWSTATAPSGAISHIWGTASNFWGVGGGGAIAHFDGSTWTTITPSPTTAALLAVWGSSATDVWAAGVGTIIHYDGTSWSVVPAPTATVNGLWGSGPSDVWAVGGATILHYDGTAWTKASGVPNVVGLHAVWGVATNDVWASGLQVILHYDGVSWTPVRSPASTGLYALTGTARHVFVFGGDASAPFAGEMDRMVPWSCESHELECNDAVDNDCDGLIDNQDPDCP
jgi:hypothetical protein